MQTDLQQIATRFYYFDDKGYMNTGEVTGVEEMIVTPTFTNDGALTVSVVAELMMIQKMVR